MSTFKDYRKKIKVKIPVIDGPESFAELREKRKEIKEDVNYKSYPASHSGKEWWEDERSTFPQKKTLAGNLYNGDFHDPIRPKYSMALATAVHHYTSTGSKDAIVGAASSGNINAYLRNRAGNKSQHIIGGFHHNNVRTAVEKLSSVFTPENTNDKPVVTYGAVPSSIGNKLESMKPGERTHFAGFTSTSSNREIPYSFAMDYSHSEKSSVDDFPIRHVVQYHCAPHTGISAVHHSEYPENEFLLHHGAHIEYMHTEHYHMSDLRRLHVHHVMVHPDHLPLDQYGAYTE